MSKPIEELIRIANDRILNEGDLDFVDEAFSADYVVHTGGRDYKGTRFVRDFVKQIRASFPDLRVEAVIALCEAGDTIAWQRTLTGTHKGDLTGIAPSRETMTWRDMLVTRFEGETIAEEWAVSDLAGELLAKLPGG